MLNKIIKYFLENKLVTVLLLVAFIVGGIVVSPFGWTPSGMLSDPIPVDAIPDIGENQQIVFTDWAGRSPQDIEDQITYPLTTYLLGIPGVKTVRSTSMFGLSSIYLIFDEDIEFYWSRSRILEKLNSLPPSLLPENVSPALGPDATGLGQVFWYTIEGRDPQGRPTGGWDLHEIRTVQDYYVRYGLNATEGVSEVASIGGFVKEYQVDVNPDALKAYGISLMAVMEAVKASNRDVGAKTIEINNAEYLVRGLGYIKSTEDLENAVVAVSENVPIRVKDIGVVSLGPAARRGILDKGGAEVVGGVVVARYGANPLQTIQNVKAKIAELAPGLPRKTLADGTQSQLTIVPFYDRSGLIYETLGTLEEALTLQVLIAILVIVVMVYNLRASLLISALLPIAVLMVFIGMKIFKVDANIVALSGIAIAIGTMVDLGVILSENIIKHLEESPPGVKLISIIYNGAAEVASAILTAVATTVVSFIPVFSLQAAEGKLFGPLAYTKTFALIAALLVTLLFLPMLAHWLFGMRIRRRRHRLWGNVALVIIGVIAYFFGVVLSATILALLGLAGLAQAWMARRGGDRKKWIRLVIDNAHLIIAVIAVVWLLGKYWIPLGPERTVFTNAIFVTLLVGLILGFFLILQYYYRPLLRWCLRNKAVFLSIPAVLILLGAVIWLGFGTVFGFVPKGLDAVNVNVRTWKPWSAMAHAFPGMGQEFMPSLDEGSFLLMPTTMAHSGVDYNRKVLGQLDMLVGAIPEVELVVGKAGRTDSPLDPAPISMFENVINYKSEYAMSTDGHRARFKTDRKGRYITVDGDTLSNEQALEMNIDPQTDLITDEDGIYFRNWRKEIRSPDDIWDEIVAVTKIPGLTSAPRLQPIETRLVMLQTGMRAPMGIKVFGPDLESIESTGLELEAILKQVPSVKSEAAFADRVVGKPYLELAIDRREAGRYGLNIEDVQQVIETAIGGMEITTTVEGRERFPVRVRYPRELRDDPESLSKILVSTPSGAQVPLGQIVKVQYVRGPQAIKSEDTFLVSFVLFDKRADHSEMDVVNDAAAAIQREIDAGNLTLPAGVSYRFSGNYENQVRASKRLSIIVPIVLLVVFLILYFQFKSVTTSFMVFLGIAMAFSGGFIMLWLFGQPWFMNFNLFGENMRELFQMHTVNLSVAVWVGFIALFGIATDDGVIMATYLDQSFARNTPEGLKQTREAVVEAGWRRIRPAALTSATTIIALLPILSSTGRGSDIMIPMAIPAFGGMLVAAITFFIVPTLYAMREERKVHKAGSQPKFETKV